MPTNMEWRDSSDVLIVPPVVIANVVPGVPSTPIELRLWNNFGGVGADPYLTGTIFNLAKDAGGPTFLAEGNEFVDRRYFQVRLTGVTFNRSAVDPSDWTDLGNDAALVVPVLANDEGIVIEVRVNAPADAPDGDYVPELQARSQSALPVGASISASTPDGTITAFVDGSVSFLTTLGVRGLNGQLPVTENPAAVDDQVFVPDCAWIAGRRSFAVIEHLELLNNLDGSAVALAAGEAYYGLIEADRDGTVTLVKGDKNTTPLVKADEPALPLGGIRLALVLREFDALIDNSDITQQAVEGNFAPSSSGLDLTLTSGLARVDDNNIISVGPTVITLPDNSTTLVYLQRDGTFAIEDDTPGGALQLGQSMQIARVVTVAGVATIYEPQSVAVGVSVFVLEMRWLQTFNNLPSTYGFFPFSRTGYLIQPPIFAADEDWGGAGNPGDVILSDIFTRRAANPYVTIFTSFATVDKRPQIAFDNTVPIDGDSFPEVVRIDPFTQVRADIVSVPNGAAANNMNGSMILKIAIP